MDNVEYFHADVRYREPLLLPRNIVGHFEDVSAQSGEPFQAARGAAFGDLDNDGQMDIVVNYLDEKPLILRNLGTANHWLTVNLRGTISNRDGIGARLHLVSEAGAHQFTTVSTGGRPAISARISG